MVLFALQTLILLLAAAPAAAVGGGEAAAFPLPLSAYGNEDGLSLLATLRQRVEVEPLNAVATALFFMAILHTFAATRIMGLAHRLQREAKEALARGTAEGEGPPDPHSVKVEMLHFLGEVEAIFGMWVLPLLLLIAAAKGWHVAEDFIAGGVNFTEPMFVVVIMALAATRPVLRATESAIGLLAGLGGRSVFAWWLSILTVGPLLGSFITEPAAMTICALLLGRTFYRLQPSTRLKYATLGLLFVNVSVGGTLTHFAAPPVLMVATKWKWGLVEVLELLGWKAVIGILISNALYALAFHKELRKLDLKAEAEAAKPREIPAWITLVHFGFLAFTVVTAHTPALFVGGFLFFLAFTEATAPHQAPVNLRMPLLVGFFLAGLVIHGSLQAWWIAPVLGSLSVWPLMLGATVLTAFNDNAAITYLASLVPGFTEELKYAVVAGAVTGGGLTVIANAPNPAGQSLLARYFDDGILPIGLLLGALVPTLVMGACFMLLR